MDDSQQRELQNALVEVFAAHGLKVSVGLTTKGIAISSQDPRVSAKNIGKVRAQSIKRRGVNATGR